MLCVGGTDATGTSRAFFSNFGITKVHVGSPAMQIYSTIITNSSGVISHTYGPLNGTSMATPIVTGAAAMTLSRLGAADGNFFKATAVRSLLMSSATLPQTPLPWLTHSRVNAGNAMSQAATQLGATGAWMGAKEDLSQPCFALHISTTSVLTRLSFAVLSTLSPLYAGTATPPSATLSFQGMVESYFNSGGNQYYSSINGLQPFDTSIRNISSPTYPPNFTGFKYNAGVIVSYTSNLRLNASGVWGVKVRERVCLRDTNQTPVALFSLWSVGTDHCRQCHNVGVCKRAASVHQWHDTDRHLHHQCYRCCRASASDDIFQQDTPNHLVYLK